MNSNLNTMKTNLQMLLKLDGNKLRHFFVVVVTESEGEGEGEEAKW